jgi:hypothetical protein
MVPPDARDLQRHARGARVLLCCTKKSGRHRAPVHGISPRSSSWASAPIRSRSTPGWWRQSRCWHVARRWHVTLGAGLLPCVFRVQRGVPANLITRRRSEYRAALPFETPESTWESFRGSVPLTYRPREVLTWSELPTRFSHNPCISGRPALWVWPIFSGDRDGCGCRLRRDTWRLPVFGGLVVQPSPR